MIVLEEGANKTSLIRRTKVWWDVWSVICYYTLSLATSFNDINFDIIFILQLIHNQYIISIVHTTYHIIAGKS